MRRRGAIDHLEVYRPDDNRDLGWGIRVNDAGYTHVKPGVEYPPQRHPAPYMFTWQQGRRLNVYQIVFIGKGGGVLETEHGGVCPIDAGTVFLLFPGEWHRYRPDPTTGWTERWCGFSGPYADQVFRAFFSVRQPVLQNVPCSRVRSRLRRLTRLLEGNAAANVSTLAGELVGLLTDLAPHAERERTTSAKEIAAARDALLASFRENVDLEALAARFNMGYSLFRREFKLQTGYAPHAYVLAARLNCAKSLLSSTRQSLASIARESGFATLPYFSRIFRKHVGCTPAQWRRQAKDVARS